MITRISGGDMMDRDKCAHPKCNSYALNLWSQGIETFYCDVCYWRECYRETLLLVRDDVPGKCLTPKLHALLSAEQEFMEGPEQI